jgi:hypothetical protein
MRDPEDGAPKQARKAISELAALTKQPFQKVWDDVSGSAEALGIMQHFGPRDFAALCASGIDTLLYMNISRSAAIKILKNTALRKAGEAVLWQTVWDLASGSGVELSGPMPWLLVVWARYNLGKINGGTPQKWLKSVAVATAYANQIIQHPKRKDEAIIFELGQRYKLGRRRMRKIISEEKEQIERQVALGFVIPK